MTLTERSIKASLAAIHMPGHRADNYKRSDYLPGLFGIINIVVRLK